MREGRKRGREEGWWEGEELLSARGRSAFALVTDGREDHVTTSTATSTSTGSTSSTSSTSTPSTAAPALHQQQHRRHQQHQHPINSSTATTPAGSTHPATPPTRKPSTGDPPGILQMSGTVTTEASSSQMVSSSPFSPSWMWGKGRRLQGQAGRQAGAGAGAGRRSGGHTQSHTEARQERCEGQRGSWRR